MERMTLPVTKRSLRGAVMKRAAAARGSLDPVAAVSERAAPVVFTTWAATMNEPAWSSRARGDQLGGDVVGVAGQRGAGRLVEPTRGDRGGEVCAVGLEGRLDHRGVPAATGVAREEGGPEGEARRVGSPARPATPSGPRTRR